MWVEREECDQQRKSTAGGGQSEQSTMHLFINARDAGSSIVSDPVDGKVLRRGWSRESCPQVKERRMR